MRRRGLRQPSWTQPAGPEPDLPKLYLDTSPASYVHCIREFANITPCNHTTSPCLFMPPRILVEIAFGTPSVPLELELKCGFMRLLIRQPCSQSMETGLGVSSQSHVCKSSLRRAFFFTFGESRSVANFSCHHCMMQKQKLWLSLPSCCCHGLTSNDDSGSLATVCERLRTDTACSTFGASSNPPHATHNPFTRVLLSQFRINPPLARERPQRALWFEISTQEPIKLLST
ncbi:hypothetical protein BCR34DRAFT_1266 [Clohesyomyces aquaticus]|uniref:Uncharacterized protein n=1 Tax=Clohesyomyces aquaticus TaxID=1231657 RepID=A0A1Y2ACH5_9PLEO|nr:hypothetical protein BCR34DRAFT_1266 [Clohesyomyces aquaticus]